jgi:hypothetical protein
MNDLKVTALAGGVGGAKLLVGLARVVYGDALTAIVNTGDDTIVYGVHVAPDVDIVTYWLAGVADTARGWGLRDDSRWWMRWAGSVSRAGFAWEIGIWPPACIAPSDSRRGRLCRWSPTRYGSL